MRAPTMLTIDDLQRWPRDLAFPLLAIGVFDGVHVGHREILRRLVERARLRSGAAMVLTFRPHPQKVIRPSEAPMLLQTERQKLEMLKETGLDVLIRLPFTRKLSLLTPEEFAESILARHGVREIHVGSNFRFGHRRSGDFRALDELGKRWGFEVHEIKPVCLRGERVSSTRIRRLLLEGRVAAARRLLGRAYQIQGTVVRGAGRGADIGFPTANLLPENELVPAVGVYSTRALINGHAFPAVTNVGFRPTVDREGPSTPVVETHLLDYVGDLYGKSMGLDFCRRIRPEIKFSGVDELKRRIERDVERTRAYLGRLAARGWRGNREDLLG